MDRSKAVSAQYRNTCRTCGAAPYEPCRTLTTGRVTDTHMPRIDEQFIPEITIDLNVRIAKDHTYTYEGKHQYPGDILRVGQKVFAIEPESGIRIPAEIYAVQPWDNEYNYVELSVDWEKAEAPK